MTCVGKRDRGNRSFASCCTCKEVSLKVKERKNEEQSKRDKERIDMSFPLGSAHLIADQRE